MARNRGGRRIAGAFQIVKSGEMSYRIGIPPHMGEDLVETGIFFTAQYVDEGILLRPLAKIEHDQPLPKWAKEARNESD